LYKLITITRLHFNHNSLIFANFAPVMKRLQLFFTISAAVALASCRGGGATAVADVGADAAPAVIERYDLAVAEYAGLDSAWRADFRSRYAAVDDVVLRLYASSRGVAMPVGDAGTDSLLVEYAGSRGVTMFTDAVRRRLGSLDSVERALGVAVARAEAMVPELKVPRLCGVVSVYSQAIILEGDSLALIGLNHYLGADDEAYRGFDTFVRREKVLSALPGQLLEALLSSQAPYDVPAADATALSRMLYAGGVAWLSAQLTAAPDFGSVLGWDGEESAWAVENEAQAWDALISRRLLYSTDVAVGERLTRPAPATALLHPQAPGRYGTWLGMRIVDAYVKSHPDMKPWQLLQKSFYANSATLVESGYNPLDK
jgi:hypothetical protein